MCFVGVVISRRVIGDRPSCFAIESQRKRIAWVRRAGDVDFLNFIRHDRTAWRADDLQVFRDDVISPQNGFCPDKARNGDSHRQQTQQKVQLPMTDFQQSKSQE